VLAVAGGEHDPGVAVGRQADDLEPAVGVRHEQQRSVGQPARPDVDASLAGHDPAGAGRDIDDRDLRGLRGLRPALGHDREARPVGRPLEAVDIDAGLGQDGRLRRLRFDRGPTATRDRRVDQPDLRPAAAARQEREAEAVGRPARLATASGLAHGPRQSAAVDLDDPDLVVTDERQPAAVGGPLWIGHGLL
jgi:hypothetical protein